jgi:hypothetical protein
MVTNADVYSGFLMKRFPGINHRIFFEGPGGALIIQNLEKNPDSDSGREQ